MKQFILCLSCFLFSFNGFSQSTVNQDSLYSYLHVDEPPFFPGCEKKTGYDKRKCSLDLMDDYIKAHMIYPKQAKKKGYEGKAVIAYTINLDGSIEEIELIRDLEYGCGEEALRIFQELKASDLRFEPAQIDNRPVRVRNKTVVRFYLGQDAIFNPRIKESKAPEKKVKIKKNNY